MGKVCSYGSDGRSGVVAGRRDEQSITEGGQLSERASKLAQNGAGGYDGRRRLYRQAETIEDRLAPGSGFEIYQAGVSRVGVFGYSAAWLSAISW